MVINSNNGFDPLEEVWLGDVYDESFYSHLPNEIEDAFCKITEITKADLHKINAKLNDLGILVRRPEYATIDDCIDDYDNLIKPEIAPRDDNIVLGNALYHLRNKFKTDPWRHALDDYKANGAIVHEHVEGPWGCISPPCIVRVGRDLYIDKIYHEHVWGMVTEPLFELSKDYRVHVSLIDGHSDAIFCPVAEGLILTTEYKTKYGNTFPDWEIYNINHSRRNIKNGGFRQWNTHDGTVNENKAFAKHIQDKATSWVGSYQETVFDVNLLVIDDKNVMTIGDDHKTNEFLAKKGFNVHVCEFRNRNFWDGGMHCMTVDIRRKGNLIDYFPERGGNYMDWLDDDR